MLKGRDSRMGIFASLVFFRELGSWASLRRGCVVKGYGKTSALDQRVHCFVEYVSLYQRTNAHPYLLPQLQACTHIEEQPKGVFHDS